MRLIHWAAVAALTVASPAVAQQAIGEWRGTLAPAPAMTLRLAIHIQKAHEGDGLVGSLDSLDQGAMGIPISAVTLTGDRLTFAVPAVSGRFDGKWVAGSNSWSGSWSQGPSSMPLTLALTPDTKSSASLAVPASWTMPDAAVTASLDTLVATRPGISAVAGLVQDGHDARCRRHSFAGYPRGHPPGH